MSVKKQLKSINFLRRIVKDTKTWKEYFHDARSFNKYYMEKSDLKGLYDYRMLMLIHNLEKGMCMPSPQPFGKDKVTKLVKLIKYYETEGKTSGSIYKMTLSILYQWLCFFESHNWKEDSTYKEIKSFLKEYNIDLMKENVGYDIVKKDQLIFNSNPSFIDVVSTRKSVRTFISRQLDENDIVECVNIAMMAPTACNRQMCGIIQVSERKLCDLITDTIYGAAGFSRDTVNYFMITFDINALDYYGERNQGYFNAGLVAMNFCNALHYKGIASCFLQWANTAKEDEMIRKVLGISEHERIAVVIGAGYYADEMLIARSCRRGTNEIFRKI